MKYFINLWYLEELWWKFVFSLLHFQALSVSFLIRADTGVKGKWWLHYPQCNSFSFSWVSDCSECACEELQSWLPINTCFIYNKTLTRVTSHEDINQFGTFLQQQSAGIYFPKYKSCVVWCRLHSVVSSFHLKRPFDFSFQSLKPQGGPIVRF